MCWALLPRLRRRRMCTSCIGALGLVLLDGMKLRSNGLKVRDDRDVISGMGNVLPLTHRRRDRDASIRAKADDKPIRQVPSVTNPLRKPVLAKPTIHP